MALDEAIKVLRQHNVTGASVLRITRGQALEKDLLSQVLDSCEQLISEKAEYKRLLKVAVDDIQDILHYANSISVCFHCVHRIDTCYGKPACETEAKWTHLEEALKLIGEGGENND